ncbi:MAG: futalosine hydrolase [Saprospiraceae bacterium]
MDILLVAATSLEIAPTFEHLERHFQKHPDGVYENVGTRVLPLVTGIGIAATAWHLGRYFALFRPDWALNAGIAGAFHHTLHLGDVVQVASERYGDLGVEEADGQFADLFDLGLAAPNEPPFREGVLKNPAAEQTAFLPLAHGLTVNRVHGCTGSIESVLKKYPDVQVETMESAAFFQACLLAEVPFVALRSISNYVEPRNRAAWQIGPAVERLNAVVVEMLMMVK